MGLNSTDAALVRLIRAAEPLDLSAEDWNAVVGRAERTGLAPLLFAALKDAGSPVRISQDLSDRLRSSYLQRTLANTALAGEAARLLAAFRRAGIPLVLLKGIALIHSIYDDAGARALGDIDILIRPADQARVKALLASEGYEDAPDLAAGFREEYESERTFVRRGEPPFALDVHWHLFNVPYFRERVSLDWFWEHTLPVTIAGEPGRMFDPPAQLLHLSAHYAFHHRAEGLRWLYDVALLITRNGGDLRWAEALATARRFGLNAAVQSTLSEVQETWGVALPDEAQDALRANAVTRSEQLAFAAITSPQNRARILWDVWNMPGMRGKLTYLGRSVFPEKAYMLRRYGIEDPRWLPWYYARRIVDGAGYFVRSLGSIAKNVTRSILRTPK